MTGKLSWMSQMTATVLNCHLKARWKQYYELSEQMILKKPDIYQQIRAMLNKVCETTIDIEAYFDTACRISVLLEQMGPGTVFYNYFFEQINPRKRGDVRYFRMLCRDLREQIKTLNHWRKKRRQIRLLA